MTRRCAYRFCDRELPPSDHHRKYCSRACQSAEHRRRLMDRYPQAKSMREAERLQIGHRTLRGQCLKCGGDLYGIRDDILFCSDACRKAFSRSQERPSYLILNSRLSSRLSALLCHLKVRDKPDNISNPRWAELKTGPRTLTLAEVHELTIVAPKLLLALGLD